MEILLLQEVHIDELLAATVEMGCSELRLHPDQIPCIRFRAGFPWIELSQYEEAHSEQIHRMIHEVLSKVQIRQLERAGVLDFRRTVALVGGFNGHISTSNGCLEADFTRRD